MKKLRSHLLHFQLPDLRFYFQKLAHGVQKRPQVSRHTSVRMVAEQGSQTVAPVANPTQEQERERTH